MIVIKNLLFKETCSACPEQYDVFYNDRMVGYVRLRWGNLTAEYPACDGETIFEYTFEKDDLKGCFDSNEERMLYLNMIANALIIVINKKE